MPELFLLPLPAVRVPAPSSSARLALRKAGAELVSITQDIGQDGSGEFIPKILNVFDEHQSWENAAHVHRAMLENARQGLLERSSSAVRLQRRSQGARGSKEKKVLVINEEEARTVRLMFA